MCTMNGAASFEMKTIFYPLHTDLAILLRIIPWFLGLVEETASAAAAA